jgi:hypothetical protein
MRAQTVCCVGGAAACCVLVITPAVIGQAVVYAAVSPVGIPCYFYRRHVATKWLAEWKQSLPQHKVTLVETYLGGPINLATFEVLAKKFNPIVYMALGDSIDGLEEFRTKYRHVPEYMLKSKFWPCMIMPDKETYISGLNYMCDKLVVANGGAEMVTVSKEFIKNLLKETQLSCSICMEDFSEENDELHITQCSHLFHAKCLEMWMNGHATCPICRRDLSEV